MIFEPLFSSIGGTILRLVINNYSRKVSEVLTKTIMDSELVYATVQEIIGKTGKFT